MEPSEYAEYRFQYFPSEYMHVLERLSFERKRAVKVLDIGCGPGNWTIAVAKYNPRAEVIGIDSWDTILELADSYGKKFECNNVQFRKLSYREAGSFFAPESFDYILTMSVLMFLDEQYYFRTVSRLLKTGGRAFMFWTHGIGYCFEEAFVLLKKRKLKEIYSSLSPIIGLMSQRLLGGDHEHPISFRRSEGIAKKYGIDLQMMGYTSLCARYYNRRFIFLPIVFNMIGKKLGSS